MISLRKCWIGLCVLFIAGAGLRANDLAGWLTPAQKLRAEQLTSLFENDTIKLQYGYCAALGDGRGLTAGRAGFTTCTDEVLQVMKAYDKKKPGNVLEPFFPRIAELADQESSDVSGLKGFKQAWKTAAEDPVFCAIQDELVDKIAGQPARAWAQKLGLKTALAKAFIYDTIIQHGNDDDPDGLPAMMERTRKMAGGTPATGINEKDWFRAFIKVRLETLKHSDDPETRAEWAESLARCEIFENLAREGNYDLRGPIKIDTDDFQATIP